MNIDVYAIPGLMTPEEIAADIWKIDIALLKVHTRKREVVECRQVLFHHLVQTTVLSPTNIGKVYDMDRNTVIHAYETVEDLLKNNIEFKKKHELFLRHIRND